MGTNPELNELQKEVTRLRILETAFREFSEKTIEKVAMTDVARAAGIGVATVYRYFPAKTALVLAVSTKAWEQYLREAFAAADARVTTAAEGFALFLDSFLDLFRSHRDLLRFNQFFNVYVENETDVSSEAMRPYFKVVDALAARFENLRSKALKDHTLRTDVSPREMMLASTHLMLAAATRYAVGLVYGGGQDPEKELVLLKNMLLREYSTSSIS